MIATNAPLQEKMTLFWHQIFATGVSKVDHYHEVTAMVDMFRDIGMGKFRDIVTGVAKNPAMIFWLDNHENHAYAVNENWGRELLELFTMGVGNYTEEGRLRGQPRLHGLDDNAQPAPVHHGPVRLGV